ncbi:MAG: sigma-70 family RNA polymerase sigma factor, partial [Spirochaetales bacterium]|nr:sigma-70 family RNA polymerase sigma factor [Spirochaetales bacterium]
ARRRVCESLTGAGQAPDPQEIFEKGQSAEAVRLALASLPRTLREPMILHYFEQLSIAEIAEVLELGQVNIKSRLLRGRRRLRRMLGEGATPPGQG